MLRLSGAFGWAAISSILLAGCAVTDNFQDRVAQFDRAAEQARDEMLLTNVVRASRHEPLSFVSVSSIHGSAQTQGNVGIPSLVLGPLQTAIQHQYIFGSFGAQSGGSPNSVSAQGTTSIDVSVQETKDFYRGLLTPVSPKTVEFFIAQGIQREILFYLFTDSVIETKAGHREIIRNNPRSPTFEKFKRYVALAMEYGLSSELVESPPGAKGKEHAEASRLCYDPLLKAPGIEFRGNRPICGSNERFDKAHNVSTFLSAEGIPVSIEIRPRSTFEIFNYLGALVAAGDEGLVRLTNQDEHGAEKVDDLLFRVETGAAGPCFVSVGYGSSIYCVPDGSAPNTTKILGLLAQLLALNTTINDLPATPSVRIVP